MFSKDGKPGAHAPTATPEPSRQSTRSPTQSIISRDLKIKGDLIRNGDIQIDGAVEGEVQSRSIAIGEGADIRGAISGDDIRDCGSVNGQVKGDPAVLTKSAKAIGDVMHQTLAVEPGAFFEGRCSRIVSPQTGDRVAVVRDRPVAGSRATPATAATR